MKKTVIESEFIDEMLEQSESISYEGLKTLFEYLEQLEEDVDFEIEFHPYDLHAEYSEYKKEDLLLEYDIESIEELEQKTTVIKVGETERYIVNTCF